MYDIMLQLEKFVRSNPKFNEKSSILGQIAGRFNCSGMNDVAGLDKMANFSSFEFRVGSCFKVLHQTIGSDRSSCRQKSVNSAKYPMSEDLVNYPLLFGSTTYWFHIGNFCIIPIVS
ncbi:unnamed protein product [Thelazia callipaeda]|uniref:DNA-directed RNA polymerase n=1 Tax=Thelazia callipaeda TaxID=103827 RepID=A0A0N5CS47_THECL|nr:unnamed protein product [Thelazia callipaeda]